MNEKGEPIITNMEKTDELIEFFTSAFSGRQVSYVSQVPEPLDGNCRGKVPSTVI